MTRLTWTLFLFGVCTPFTAEFNKRMQTGTFSVSGKIVFQWNCEDPTESPDLPYLMTRQGQKFVLSWIVTDTKESFDLKVNNESLDALKYLDSAFRISDDKVSVFQAHTKINGVQVTSVSDTFEHLPGRLTHKILEKIADVTPVTQIDLSWVRLDNSVLNESIASFC